MMPRGTQLTGTGKQRETLTKAMVGEQRGILAQRGWPIHAFPGSAVALLLNLLLLAGWVVSPYFTESNRPSVFLQFT